MIFGSPPLPSDTATPGAYTFCPTLAMATTLERLNSRNEAEAGDENRQFTPIRMWIGSYRVVAVVPEPPR